MEEVSSPVSQYANPESIQSKTKKLDGDHQDN